MIAHVTNLTTRVMITAFVLERREESDGVMPTFTNHSRSANLIKNRGGVEGRRFLMLAILGLILWANANKGLRKREQGWCHADVY